MVGGGSIHVGRASPIVCTVRVRSNLCTLMVGFVRVVLRIKAVFISYSGRGRANIRSWGAVFERCVSRIFAVPIFVFNVRIYRLFQRIIDVRIAMCVYIRYVRVFRAIAHVYLPFEVTRRNRSTFKFYFHRRAWQELSLI